MSILMIHSGKRDKIKTNTAVPSRYIHSIDLDHDTSLLLKFFVCFVSSNSRQAALDYFKLLGSPMPQDGV